MKILIAEDDMDLARLAETILRASGHEVLKAVDASQILPKARSDKPDLILLDINMPGGKGNEILTRIKRNTLTSDIPIIVISGVTDPRIHAQVLDDGAEGFLQKPWVPESLIPELQKFTPYLKWQ